MGWWDWLAFATHELALFAAIFFVIGAIDEGAVDLTYLWLYLKGRTRHEPVDEAALQHRSLSGLAVVFIPAWREDAIIGSTITHLLAAWPQHNVQLFVGCYRNDPSTAAAARTASGSDVRVHTVVHPVDGPTCKADNLNRLFAVMKRHEVEMGIRSAMVVLHDAEDMVDPAALSLLDGALADCDFAQLPVLALPQPRSRWIAGHYTDEFAESHARTMVVRDALASTIPGAGVGCAIRRDMLSRLDRERSGKGPFAAGSLTEDYELGLTIGPLGGRGRFIRRRTTDGRLIATRAFFPATLDGAIRQKTRWTHGIAFQSWDRLGWSGGIVDRWMQLRDRRGPHAALLLAIAYLLLIVAGAGYGLRAMGFAASMPISRELAVLLDLTLLGLIWRAAVRGIFTGYEFGVREGALAIARIIVSNIVAIMAVRRAIFAYVRSLRGAKLVWDKTHHVDHPAVAREAGPS